jgi:hypothetical protein
MLQPKSIPCIFVGYSLTQNAYNYLDPLTNKLYHSRYVLFNENKTKMVSLLAKYPSLARQVPHLSMAIHHHLLSLYQ